MLKKILNILLICVISSFYFVIYASEGKVELIIQKGHSGSINSVAFSPDGRYIVSGSNDKTLIVWDVITGKEIRSFEGHFGLISREGQGGSISAVAFSPDGKYVLSGSSDSTLKLWNVSTGKEIRTFRGHDGGVSSAAFSSDGKYIVSGGSDTTCKIWNMATGNSIKTLNGHTGGISSVRFSPDGKFVLSASIDKTLKLWDLSSGKVVKTFTDHSGDILAAAFSPNGENIASGSGDKTIKLWNASSGIVIKTFYGHNSDVTTIDFSPDGRSLLSGSTDKTIRIWDLDSGREQQKLKGSSYFLSAAFSPDGTRVLSGSWNNTLVLWNVKKGKEEQRFKGHANRVTAIAFSTLGKYIANGYDDNSLVIWDKYTGREVTRLLGHSDRISSVAFSPDDKLVVTGSLDRTVRLWETDTGKEIKNFKGHSFNVLSVAFSSDGKYIASGSWDRTARIWNRETGEKVINFNGHGGIVTSVAFSPDDKYIASGSYDRTIIIWERKTGKQIKRFSGHNNVVSSVAYSRDGKFVASGSWDSTVRVWDLSTGREVQKFTQHSLGVLSVAFSRDGKYILSGSEDTTVKLWDRASGKMIRNFDDNAHVVTSVSFSPDGKYIASGGFDCTVKLWNLADGRCINFISFDTRDWFVYDSHGRFYCSSDGRNYVGFVKGLNYYEPDQFWEKFFKPDLMQRFLEGKKFPDIKIEKAEDNVPKLTIISPDHYGEVEEATITVRIKAEPGGNGLGKVFLYHDGSVVDERTSGVSMKNKGNTYELTLNLMPGDNNLVAGAYDRSGGVEGRSSRIVVTYKPKQVVKPDMYVFSVGVSEYQNKRLKLDSPNRDAEKIAEKLKQVAESSKLYGTVHTEVLTDTNATRANILAKLEAMSMKTRLIDAMVIYLSGHGMTQKNVYHFLGHDAQTYDLLGSCVTDRHLSDIIRRMQARKVVLFFDTCQSGAAAQKMMFALSRGVEEEVIISTLAKKRGIAVFSAANAFQKAYEIKKLKHGIFTYCMLDALGPKKELVMTKGFIYIDKLLSEVEGMTIDTARKYLRQEQSPIRFRFGQDFPIGK